MTNDTLFDENKWQNDILSLFTQLHQYPELSNQEYKTTELLREYLQKKNIKILELGAKTGVIAEIGHGQPIVALRADIDALPIEEKATVDYSSKNKGVMHACGHDSHATILMAAAYLLKAKESELKGTIRLFFQPAEEVFNGALQFISIGALNNVDLIFGIHNNPRLAINEFGTSPGPFSANADRIEIFIEGKGSHGSRPESGIDPIIIGSQIINSIQTISSRTISGQEPVVVSVTKFLGGNTWNVIPQRVELEGTVRTCNPETRQKVKQQLKQIVEYTALSLGGKAELVWYDGAPAVINSPQWANFAKQQAAEFGYNVIDLKPKLGGEDFSQYLNLVPGAFFNVGSQSDNDLHHQEFKIDRKMIVPAAKYFAKLAEAALNELSTTKP